MANKNRYEQVAGSKRKKKKIKLAGHTQLRVSGVMNLNANG